MRRARLVTFIICLQMPWCQGCNRSNTSQTLETGSQVHQDVVQAAMLMPKQCPKQSVVFFFGSSEATSKIEHWEINVPSRIEVEEAELAKAQAMSASIQKASKDLLHAFSTDPGCEVSSGSHELLFVSVIDGPSQGDSHIVSHWFRQQSGAWSKAKARYWTIKGASLQSASPLETLELDMSQAVAKIADIFSTNEFESLQTRTTLKKGLFQPTQVSYVLKTHGARIAAKKNLLPTLENLKQYPRQTLKPADWTPALFMDTNGPTGSMSSDVFSPHWDDSAAPDSVAGDGLNDTAGDGFNDTAGDGFQDLSTSGAKALSYSKANLPLTFDEDFPGKTVFGSFATYGLNTPSSLSLPVAVTPAVSLTADSPANFIILDSCYGSERILKSLTYGGAQKGHTVVLASESPIYFEFLDYGTLTLESFWKLPTLLGRLEKKSDLSDLETKLLVKMTKGSLSWPEENNTTNDFKKLSIWQD